MMFRTVELLGVIGWLYGDVLDGMNLRDLSLIHEN